MTLGWCLGHRWSVIIGATVIFLSSFGLLSGIKKEFVPSQDQSIFLVRLQTPVGSSIEYTDTLIKEAEERVGAIPEVKRYFAAIGGFGGVSQVNTGMMFVTLKPRDERKRSHLEIMAATRETLGKIKNLRPVIQDLSTAGFSAQRGFPIEFSIRGPDWDTLIKESLKIRDKLKEDKRYVDLDSNYDEGMPEVKKIGRAHV